MKKILLSIFFLLVSLFSLQAQILYGTTFNGGSKSGGTVNRFVPGTNELTVITSFDASAANPVYTHLIQAADGKLYGVTSMGGSNGGGTIFSFDPSTSHYMILQHLNFNKGTHPTGSLIQLSDGKLYGMTSDGGTGNFGVIFSFDPSSNTYSKLKIFNNSDGKHPHGSLIQANDGKLYGMTYDGGTADEGTIFSFDPSTLNYTKLADFDYTNGANPYGSLMQASDGKLYGMTSDGGISGPGVIFSFDLSTSVITKLRDFEASGGYGPYGSLLQLTDGKLYGMTANGGTNGLGVIFSFDPSNSEYAQLKSFDKPNATAPEGAFPYGDLIEATDGKLYGLTSDGGASNGGVIFSYDPLDSAYTKLRDFDAGNGAHPKNSLVQASDGNLYGMTYDGSGNDLGVIFSFNPADSIYTKLSDFQADGGTSGSVAAGLMQAGNGKIYGVTAYDGVLFSFDPTTLNFGGGTGFGQDRPSGTPVQASNGKLYGTANGGDRFLYGYLYSFDPSSGTKAKLKQFNDPGNEPNDGAAPAGSLITATDGKLYGIASGGAYGAGVIFSFDPSSSAYLSRYDFNSTTGGNGANLFQASDGKLYGTASGGSHNVGVIFSFDLTSSTYVKLLDFDSTNGASPSGGLVQANDGKLYGITSRGGDNFFGVIFSYDPSSSTFTRLYDFDSTNGANPLGRLIQASDGKLYGTASEGGSSGNGVIFSYDIATSTYTKLLDFNFLNGANPYAGFIQVPEGGPLPVTLISLAGKNSGNINQVTWKVGNEQHLDYYELQRSTDGQNFKKISEIKATGNTSYTYNDPVATAGSLYYYRLKSVDKDGNSKFSEVIKIRRYLNGFAVVTPNPFTNKLLVNVESFINDKATFILTDLGGRRLIKEHKLLSPGTNAVDIHAASRLSKGTYLLTIITSEQTQSIKVIKGN